MKTVKIILSPEAKEVFRYLNREAETSKQERSILNAVKQKSEFIKANLHYGTQFQKN